MEEKINLPRVFMMLLLALFLVSSCSFGTLGTRSGSDVTEENPNLYLDFSFEEIKKANYEDVVTRFEAIGFTNIILEEKDDLIIGLLNKEGQIARVSINGVTDFSSGYFPKDAKIVIEYHVFTKSKTETEYIPADDECPSCGAKLMEISEHRWFCEKCDTEWYITLYCPNCGDDMAAQEDFEEWGYDFWVCDKCGEIYFSDCVWSTMKEHEGILWFCTECGDVLNLQNGFIDDCGAWSCTYCHRLNYIECLPFECPYCHNDFTEQNDFDYTAAFRACEKCGQIIYGSKVDSTMHKYSGVIWICDECGDVLSAQDDFDDRCGKWECLNCGHKNLIDESQIVG